MSRSTALVTADWVQENLSKSKVVLVEVDEDTSLYEKNHIEGASTFHWRNDLQDGVIRDIVSKEKFELLLSKHGIANDSIVVLYGGNNNWFATYAYWYFKVYGHADVILDTAGPAEVDARIRLAIMKFLDLQRVVNPATIEIRGGEITIDEHSYTAKIKGRSLDLTYKEFELLKYLVQHPGRVFTRSQLLQEVWGYDYFGGTRTVDVHIRRLRAKLGPEHEALIGTVRHVGYRFNTTNSQNQGVAALSEH